jgi:hypothetical protein
METGAREKLDLLFKLAELGQDEFREALNEAVRDGYVTKPDFERFVTVMHERLDGLERVSTERADAHDEVLKLKVENVELKLKAEQREGLDKYIDERLPDAVAKLHREQRSNVVNFFRKRFMLIVSIIMTITAALSLWAAIQSAAELRDIKSVAKLANELNDALDP